MMNNKQIAIAKHNASKKRHADIFTGCLSAGTLASTQENKTLKNIKTLRPIDKSVDICYNRVILIERK